MTLQECYIALGGDYEDVLARLRSERLVQKFVLKFLDDKSFELLSASLAAMDYKEAFRAAHTIKGMCQNLSFTRLLASSSILADALRSGQAPEGDGGFGQVAEDYMITVTAIRKYRDENGGRVG